MVSADFDRRGSFAVAHQTADIKRSGDFVHRVFRLVDEQLSDLRSRFSEVEFRLRLAETDFLHGHVALFHGDLAAVGFNGTDLDVSVGNSDVALGGNHLVNRELTVVDRERPVLFEVEINVDLAALIGVGGVSEGEFPVDGEFRVFIGLDEGAF